MNARHHDMDDMAEHAHRLPRLAKGLDYQGRHPQAAEACTELGFGSDEPIKPGLLARAWRWVCTNQHDRCERMALQNRLIALDALEEEVRHEVEEIRAVMFTGSGRAAAEAAQQVKARGHELDGYREERLRCAAKLALLDKP